ncbi:MAG: V-type ATP synthase subunit F [Symbiobacteriaceae bacterium]|nr:V-type ATP synthase subunit F [Symbiobacteriaceae bacterium]
MRFYVLSEFSDVCLGMRMAGMEGEVIRDATALDEALTRLGDDPDIAVIIINESLARFAPERITQWKLKRQQPLLVEIPDRQGSGNVSQNIVDYIAATIGIHIE